MDLSFDKKLTNNGNMNWQTPQYSKSKVNWAGDILIDKSSSQADIDEAIKILNNWRAAHSFPLNTFQVRLKNKSKGIDNQALVVQRLKRVPAILNKLKRHQTRTMKLSQMQDIGGCRSVVSSVEMAKTLYQKSYIKSGLRHKLVNEKDYITNPKSDGYRSIHLVYKYNSDKKTTYNDLLIEVQIRSKLQHLWATAIETADFFTKQSVKFGLGEKIDKREKEWGDFFKLVSSAFAEIENTNPIPNTPNGEELYNQIKEKTAKLNVIGKMKGWTTAVQVIEERFTNMRFFLLELDVKTEKLQITAYRKNEEEKATTDYSKAEERNKGRTDTDVVLVGAETTHDLKKAYPNYFVDTREFLENLINYLRRKT